MDCEKSCLQQAFFDTLLETMSIENYLMYSPTSYTSNALDDHERWLGNEVMIYRDPEQQNQLKKLIAEFALLWEDSGNMVDVLEEQ